MYKVSVKLYKRTTNELIDELSLEHAEYGNAFNQFTKWVKMYSLAIAVGGNGKIEITVRSGFDLYNSFIATVL